MYLKMTTEYVFTRPVRRFGLLGLSGVVVFTASLIALHLMGTEVDLMRDYVSNLANVPLRWIFFGGVFVHGLGNLALTLGLHGALPPGHLRSWGVLLLGGAALGILLTVFFPIDPPGLVPSTIGLVHRIIAGSTFVLELIALFVFSVAFGRYPHWRRLRTVSVFLSACAVVALAAFLFAVLMKVVPGLAERVALAVFLVWEVLVALQLARPR
jgi:hypothetical membrane protein